MIYIRFMFISQASLYIYWYEFYILLTYSNATEIHIIYRLRKLIMYHFNKILVSLYFSVHFIALFEIILFLLYSSFDIYIHFLKVIKYFLNKSTEYDIYMINERWFILFNVNYSKKYFKSYFIINRITIEILLFVFFKFIDSIF